MAQITPFSDDSLPEFEEMAISQGRKLGFLIAKSELLSDEEKEALLTVLPEMSPEQLDELTVTLEAQHVLQQKDPNDAVVKEGLVQAEDEYNQAMDKASGDTLKKLDQLQKKVSGR